MAPNSRRLEKKLLIDNILSHQHFHIFGEMNRICEPPTIDRYIEVYKCECMYVSE